MKTSTLNADGSWTQRDMTSEEEASLTAAKESFVAFRKAADDAATKKASDAAAGKAKLKELGLTDDQIAALLG
jgi:hypothetical protein|tara:strand:+ start:1257 stop:1475 length:219 start_codon:yes stop_codon:yes gene_type:complete